MKDIQITNLEKIVVNIMTPFVYLKLNKSKTFDEITNLKINSYKRLLNHFEKGNVPQSVIKGYSATTCGRIAIYAAKTRYHLEKHNF